MTDLNGNGVVFILLATCFFILLCGRFVGENAINISVGRSDVVCEVVRLLLLLKLVFRKANEEGKNREKISPKDLLLNRKNRHTRKKVKVG